MVHLDPPLQMPEIGQEMKSTLGVMELSAYQRPTFVLKEKTNLATSLLEAKATGFHGQVMKLLFVTPVGIGSLAEIIAVKCAWIWSVLRLKLNKILLKVS
jgi:hypothetical protein